MKKILIASSLLIILSATAANAWHGGSSGHHPEPGHYQAPATHHPEPGHNGNWHGNNWHRGAYVQNNTAGNAQTQTAPGYYDHGGGHEQAADNQAIHEREMQDPNHTK